ncbi:MAG: class I SAM-dependent methyltransferase [Anaerolineae bacterium]|nr:class I SAM-dependent methyltransferase [Anaerolineae bacterium]
MDRTQLQVVNSRIRQLFQKYYEFRIHTRYLRQHQIDLTGGVILDAGCGSGYSTRLLVETFQPSEVYAFDIMPEQVELAKQQGLPAVVTVGDITAIDFPAQKFDAAFAFFVFHHAPDWSQAIAEVHRVLKPGGVLLGGEPKGKHDEEVAFEWTSFVQELERSGFDVVESKNMYLGFFNSFMAVKRPPLDARPAPAAGARPGE